MELDKVAKMTSQEGPLPLTMLSQFARLLAEVNSDMTIRAVLLLCEVMREPNQPVSYYAKFLDMPLSTTSRLLLDLSETSRSKSRPEGVNLLERRQNPASYREVLYRPSPLAVALFAKVGRRGAPKDP